MSRFRTSEIQQGLRVKNMESLKYEKEITALIVIDPSGT
jgi:hypothetical protein